MAKLTRGTVLTIDSRYRMADQALSAIQAFFRANPHHSENSAKAAGYGHLFTTRDRVWRLATGSKLTLTSCPCGLVNPHVTAELVTTCCGSRTVTVR